MIPISNNGSNPVYKTVYRLMRGWQSTAIVFPLKTTIPGHERVIAVIRKAHNPVFFV
jgi:hypothetical protein